MIYKPFFRDDLGYKPRYTQPLHLEEVVVSPIYDSENEDSEIDINSLGYKPVYKNIWEGVEMNPSKKESVLSYTFQSKEDFKNAMIPIYANILSEKGLNPLFAKSLVAQDGLESAWGSKPSGDNNFGGIKGKGRVKRTREVINGKDIYLDQEFRNFNSLEDYAEYKVNLLNGKRYKAFDGGLEDFSRRVSAGGYATDPRYKEVLDKVIMNVRNGGILKLQSGSKIDRVNGDYIHQFPKLWDILTYSGISDVAGNTLDYIATMPKVDAEVLTPILLRLEDYLSRNNKRSWEDLTSNEKYNLINLSSNLNKLDFSKGFTNGLDDDFRYLQGLVSRVSNDELDSLLNMDLSPTSLKEGFQLLKNKPKSIKLLDIKRVANIINNKYDAGLDTSLIGLKRGGRLEYDTSSNDKIDYLTEKLKKGGRIEKASLGTIFSTNKPRDQRRSGVELSTINSEIIPDFSSFYYNVPIDVSIPRMHNYKTRRVYDLNQVAKDGDRYYDIIHNRTRDAKNALKRNGFVKDLDFLSQILALQSIRETGWIDRHSSNNYGGYTEGEGEDKVKLSFSSPDEFWDHHISNLNSKWGESNVRGPWYDAKSLDDYINRINNPDLNTTKENYNKYNYNRRIKGESEQYLYAPIWDNKGRNYLDDIKEVVDRYFYYYNN